VRVERSALLRAGAGQLAAWSVEFALLVIGRCALLVARDGTLARLVQPYGFQRCFALRLYLRRELTRFRLLLHPGSRRAALAPLQRSAD